MSPIVLYIYIYIYMYIYIYVNLLLSLYIYIYTYGGTCVGCASCAHAIQSTTLHLRCTENTESVKIYGAHVSTTTLQRSDDFSYRAHMYRRHAEMARACYVQMYAAYETRCYDVCRVLASIDYDTRPHDEKKTSGNHILRPTPKN